MLGIDGDWGPRLRELDMLGRRLLVGEVDGDVDGSDAGDRDVDEDVDGMDAGERDDDEDEDVDGMLGDELDVELVLPLDDGTCVGEGGVGWDVEFLQPDAPKAQMAAMTMTRVSVRLARIGGIPSMMAAALRD